MYLNLNLNLNPSLRADWNDTISQAAFAAPLVRHAPSVSPSRASPASTSLNPRRMCCRMAVCAIAGDPVVSAAVSIEW